MESDIEWVAGVRDRLGLKISPLNEELHRTLREFLWVSTSTKLRLIVWNLWLPLLIAVFGLVRGIQGDRGLLAASFIILVSLPAFMLVAMAADWRYFYSIHLAAYFLAPLVRISHTEGE